MKDCIIIIPTYNEADNIPELVSRIRASMNGTRILVVDDSPNELTRETALDNGCIVNYTPKIKRGLSKAVLDGIKTAKEVEGCDRVIIMDADLQHPPEVLPSIHQALEDNDFVIASRYIKDGGIANWSWKRKLISRCANLLASPLTLFKVKDSMSGFAGFRLAGVPEVVKPRGYKIVTELMVRGNWQSIKEVPYVFGDRKQGESKLSQSHITAYLRQLLDLYLYKFRFIKFSLVGLSGILVNLAFLFLLTEVVGFSYIWSAIFASVISITNNYTWNYLWTFRDKKTGLIQGWFQYLIMAGIASWLYLLLLILLTETLGIWYMLSATIAILVTFVLRYFVASRYIWK